MIATSTGTCTNENLNGNTAATTITSTVTRDKSCCSNLSEYEIVRAKNIERNNARLYELGLISLREQQISNASAWKKPTIAKTAKTAKKQKEPNIGADNGNNGSTSSRKRTLDESSAATINDHQPPDGRRKSLRLQGIQAVAGDDLNDEISFDNTSSMTPEEIQQQREQRRLECRAMRQRIAVQYSIDNDNNDKHPATASYDHCLMRVQSMTHKQLANRIRIIERAAGKHCIIKMAITASCLHDAGLWELATLANESLERLKACIPPPE